MPTTFDFIAILMGIVCRAWQNAQVILPKISSNVTIKNGRDAINRVS